MKVKNYLESVGIIVSIGSACNTSSSRQSHVLDDLGADKYICNGTLRISIGDYTSDEDVDLLIYQLNLIAKQAFNKK